MRQKWTAWLAGLMAGVAVMHAGAQEYPARPITVIIPFSAGSASDVIGRIVLDRMAASMGRPFVVDNRPAAGGNVGTQAVVRAEPDGWWMIALVGEPGIHEVTVRRDGGPWIVPPGLVERRDEFGGVSGIVTLR